MNPFVRSSRADGAWHRVGTASKLPDLSDDPEDRPITSGCKAFRIPTSATECPTETDIDLPGDLKDQVLLFKYKGTIHAVDHVCPL